MNIKKYKFRFTKTNFYSKKEDTFEGWVSAKSIKEAEKKIHDIGFTLDCNLTTSYVSKTEILINAKWIEIKPSKEK